jgi:uncharacterized protein (UPF0332 family)
MRFGWERFLTLAEELAQRPDSDDAALRSSVSRAYYAAFGKAADRIEADTGSRPDWADAHKQVWEHFEGAGDRFRREIGQTGKRLKFQRIRADYRGAEVISRTDVSNSIDHAQRILTRLGQLVK